jgi:hypothetical protein
LIGDLLGRRQEVVVPCTIDIENTLDSLHAYVELQGIEVGPGDVVRVLDAPTEIPPYGERYVCERRAEVVKAGWLDRMWTHATSRFELTELYEVGFSSWRCP